MKLIFVRHGETDWNQKKILQGSVDIPLNKAGFAQAQLTAQALAHRHVDAIISSPLLRAVQTAQVLARTLHAQVQTDDRIRERSFGQKEGKPMVREEFNRWWVPGTPGEHNMEPADVFYARVFACLNELRHRYENESVLMVAHGGVSIAVQCYYKGFPESEAELARFTPNGRAIEFEQRFCEGLQGEAT